MEMLTLLMLTEEQITGTRLVKQAAMPLCPVGGDIKSA